MRQRSLFLSFGAAALLLASAAMAKQPKVDICHVPPGDPANAHLISVAAPAVPDHVAHGDRCAVVDGICTCLDSSVVTGCFASVDQCFNEGAPQCIAFCGGVANVDLGASGCALSPCAAP